MELKKLVRLCGAFTAFVFGIACLGVALIVFWSLSPRETGGALASKIFIGMLVPIALGVTSLIFGKYLLNEGLGLKRHETATPHLVKLFSSFKALALAVVFLGVLAYLGFLLANPNAQPSLTKDLSLRFIDEDGQPVANLAVAISQISCSQYQECNAEYLEYTDADGIAAFDSINEADYNVLVSPSTGYFVGESQWDRWVSEWVTEADFVLELGISYRLLAVYGPDGEPLEGVRATNLDDGVAPELFSDSKGIIKVPLALSENGFEDGFVPNLLLTKEGYSAEVIRAHGQEGTYSTVLHEDCACGD
ncbi:MAG: hypothetical protein WC607_02285 [Candidatus Micrarchaeia archaeon]